MALEASTGLRNQMLDTAALRDILDLGFIKIYAGTVPATADDALGGATLLVTISVSGGGTGLTFEAAAVSGVIEKKSSETWSGTNAATGTATFYRHIAVGDDGTSSTTQARIQGLVATAGAELNLSDTSLVSAATQTIDFYSIALPTL